MGLELEIPIAHRKSGLAVEFNELVRLFEKLEEADPGWKMDCKELCLRKVVDGYEVSIGTDVGTCGLEITFPPAGSLGEAKKNLVGILAFVSEVANGIGISLLGYGVQPLSSPGSHLVMPKDRYSALMNFVEPERAYYFTLSAATQVHVDVGKEDIARVIGVLNRFGPAMTAVFANSGILEGRQSDCLDVRNLFWDNVYQHRYPERIGLAPDFGGFDGYLDKMMEIGPLLVKREEDYFVYKGPESFRDFISQGGAEVIRIGGAGETIRLSAEVSDMFALESAVWWEARAKGAYGTVESRTCSMQPSCDHIMAVAAVVLGLAHNSNAAYDRVSGYDRGTLMKARRDSIGSGMNVQIDGTGEPIMELANDMLRLAKDGLAIAKEDVSHLAPMQAILDSKRTSAQASQEIYGRDGVSGLLRHVELRV